MGEPAKDLDYEDNEGQSRPELHSIEGGGESTPDRANLRAVPDIYDDEGEGDEPLTQDGGGGRSRSVPSPGDLSRREAEGYGPGSLPRRDGSLPQRKEKKAVDDKTGGSLYRHEGPANTADSVSNLYDNDDNKKSGRLSTILFGGKGALKNKVNKLSNRNKAILFGVGIGGSGLFILLAIMITFFATLKIPNLAEHIEAWQFARTTRAFSQSINQDTSEKIAVDSADDATFAAMKEKYLSFRSATWGKLDAWRPTLTYKNMQATGQIDFKYSETQGLLGRQKLEKVVINGTEIVPEDTSLARKVVNKVNPLTPKEDKILAGKVSATIDDALHDRHTLVRSSVNKKILSDIGVELHWWDKLGSTYRNASEAQADIIEFNTWWDRTYKTNSETSLSTTIEEATQQAKAAQDRCRKNPDCAKQFLEADPLATPPGIISDAERARLTGEYPTNYLSDEARAALISNVDDARITAAQATSAAVAVAIPACIIYDGSVEHSGGTVDANSTSAMRNFYAIASAGDQQKKGDTTAEAVGATNRKLADYTSSVPEQRARNQNVPVSTDAVSSPQASAVGTFSLVNLLLPQGPATKINSVVEPTCKAITDWKGAIAVAGIELGIQAIIAVMSGGGAEPGEVALTTTIKEAATEAVAKLAETLTTKEGIKNILQETVVNGVKQAAIVGGLTAISRMLVLSRMGAEYNGAARAQNEANLADAGGNLAASENCRKMMYGRPLTQPETTASDQASVSYLQSEKGRQGTFERYFAISNPDSLLTNMGVSMSMQLTNKSNIPKLVSDSSTRIGSTILNGSLVNAINPFKKQLAFAQAATVTDTNYQNVQWCWSEDELNRIENDPQYFPLQNDVLLNQSGVRDTIESTYSPCYTESMGDLLKEGKIQRDEKGHVYPGTAANDAGLCSPLNLGINNPKFGDMVFRWRLAHRNDNALNHLTDIQAPKAGDNSSTGTSSNSGSLGVSPDGFTFPQKTTKSKITTHNPAWCYTSQENCHHDYNAADIFADTGTPVVAARGGTVVFGRNEPTGGTGSIIVIKGDDNNIYSYIHLKSGSVKFSGGEKVKAGDQLAEVGTNEDAQNTPSHLHFDVQPPPATTREGCTNQACAQPPFQFLNPQPALVAAFNALPDN